MATGELDYEEALRRLAVNDERFLASILARRRGKDDAVEAGGSMERPVATLDGRTRELIVLAALIADGSGETSIEGAVEDALQAGASVADVVGVVIAIAPAVGSARVVDCAPYVAAAVGYDMWADLEGFGGPVADDPHAPAVVAGESPPTRHTGR
jgi:alkylhydroperoxidase/carboxymuconolactone decarboxylase family protein YurZ